MSHLVRFFAIIMSPLRRGGGHIVFDVDLRDIDSGVSVALSYMQDMNWKIALVYIDDVLIFS